MFPNISVCNDRNEHDPDMLKYVYINILCKNTVFFLIQTIEDKERQY